MKNYFGTTSTRSNGPGILDVNLTIKDDPNSAKEPELTFGRVEVHELNQDLAMTIVADAGGVLERVYLPKQINVHLLATGGDTNQPHSNRDDTAGAPYSGGLGARFAVDERNVVRDYTDWRLVAPPGGRDKYYRNPAKLWQKIRSLPISHWWAWATANRKQ